MGTGGYWNRLLRGSVAAGALIAFAQAVPALAQDQTYSFDIPAQDLGSALRAFARTSRQQVTFDSRTVRGKRAAALRGTFSARQALDTLLGGSGLTAESGRSGIFIIRPATVRESPMSDADTARPDTSSAKEDVQDESAVQDIIVTARKREEKLRDVPVSVAALTGAALQEKTLVRLTDLTAVVPNFTLSLAALLPSTNLRGFGTYGPSFAQSVGKFVDNVSYGRDIHSRIPLFDVERLEVLRGPQVLLYGNSTTAGALNITTKKPGSSLEVDALASYEFNYDETILQGGATLPLNDWASVRVAGFFQNLTRGWLVNDFNGHHDPRFHNRGGRGTLRLTPADGLTVLLKAEYTRTRDDGGSAQQIRQSTHPLRQLTEVKLDGHRSSIVSGAPFFSPEFMEVRNQEYQGDIDYETPIGTIHSTTGYLHTRQGAALSTSAGIRDNLSSYYSRYKQFSQELRMTGSSGPVDYNIGGYFENYNLDMFSVVGINFPAFSIFLPPVGGQPVPPLARYVALSQRNKSYSLFGDLTGHLTDKLSVSAGARYTILRQNNDQVSDAAPLITHQTFATSQADVIAQLDPALRPIVQTTFGVVAHSFTDIKRRENHLQPQVVLQYRPNGDTMFYGKFVRGVKQGGVDLNYGGSIARGVSRDEAIFDPESARSFEVGLKGISADRSFEYSLVAFQTTFTNLQTSAFIGTTQFVTNVGRARTRGVEAEVTIVPLPRLRINGTANFLDAKFLDFPNGVCTVAQNAATPVGGPPCKQNLSGRPTPFQSKYSGTLNLSYGIETGGLKITPSASLTAKSSYNVSPNVDPLAKQKALALIDFNLGVAPMGSGLKASVFVRNLTDKHYKEYGNATPLVPGAYLMYISRGRSIGLQLGAQF